MPKISTKIVVVAAVAALGGAMAAKCRHQ